MTEFPNHEVCPICANITLPPIKKDSLATGRRCASCGAIVDRDRQVENAQILPE